MCLIKGAFLGEKNFDVIKMHDKTIEKSKYAQFKHNSVVQIKPGTVYVLVTVTSRNM